MAWEHLSINKPHLVYIILGGFTSLFMLCSSFIKERLYIGEATIATLCGIIFGPHAANLIDPSTWGNTDQITLEFSRIVLVVQCFAVGVELPKYYMEKHWKSVVFLLVPVMTFGWLMTSLFIWWMVPPLDWLQSLCVAACVTATDPVLASSVVGKGKFAKRVPKHLRDLLSAESGCNDGMAFPFVYLALYIIAYQNQPSEVAFNWFCITILYECVFGAIYGFTIGYIGRRGIRWAEERELVDRESFLVFYFVLALFCAGSGSLIGVDDLLVGFAAGVGFSNDGWFTQKTEESHVSNVIDLLINLAYFVYFGTIIPWEQYNSAALGLTPWRLVVIAIFVILFRRIPIMMALKPLIPDIHTWREALFAGHFGPIGVGAIFVAILARADLETGGSTPLAELPAPDDPNYILIALVWPIVTFLVITSIIVHGSSIAVFTLGKHINTLTLTMSFTTANEDGPSWMNRLPRIASQSKSMSKMSDTDADEKDVPPGQLPPVGMSGNFLRRQKEEDNPSHNNSRASSLVNNKRKKKSKWDQHGPGGPISQSAFGPAPRRTHSESDSVTLKSGTSPNNEANDDEEKNEGELGDVQDDPEMHEIMHHDDKKGKKEKQHRGYRNDDDESQEGELGEIQDDPEMHEILHHNDGDSRKLDKHQSDAERHPEDIEEYQEGDETIDENENGDVLDVRDSNQPADREAEQKQQDKELKQYHDMDNSHTYKGLKKKLGVWRHKDDEVIKENSARRKDGGEKRGAALAYQFGNTIIVEDEDGEVVKKYQLPTPNGNNGEDSNGPPRKRPGMGIPGEAPVREGIKRMGTWTGLARRNTATTPGLAPNDKGKEGGEGDDHRIRFTINGEGKRMTKDAFLKELRSKDPSTRYKILSESDAPADMKELAKKDAQPHVAGNNRLFGHKKVVQQGSSHRDATFAAAQMAQQAGADVDPDHEADDAARKAGASVADRDIKHGQRAGDEPERGRTSRSNNNHVATAEGFSTSGAERETAVERHRREEALKGVDDNGAARPVSPRRQQTQPRETPAERRRREATLAQGDVPHPEQFWGGGGGGGGGGGNGSTNNAVPETPAEKRRREAALGVDGRGDESDSDDDNTARVPVPKKMTLTAEPTPTQQRRGIRFAEEPIRARK